MAHRRAFLTATAAVTGSALGGCLGALNQNNPGGIEAEIVDVVEGDDPITYGVEQDSSRLDGDELPRFSVTFRNDGDDTLVFTHGPSGMLFNPGSSDPPGLYVLKPAEAEAVEEGTSEVHVDVGENCLAVEYPPARDADEAHRTLEPDESYNDDFALVIDGDAIDNSCLDIGEYEFRQRYVYDLDIPESEDPEYVTDWGFTVSVTE